MLADRVDSLCPASLALLVWLFAGWNGVGLWPAAASETNGPTATILPGPPAEPSAGSMMLSVPGVSAEVRGSEEITFPGETEPLAPGVLAGFDAINFDSDEALTGVYQIPPDPIGAAGSNHVVNVVNSSIQWFTKPYLFRSDAFLGTSPGWAGKRTVDPRPCGA